MDKNVIKAAAFPALITTCVGIGAGALAYKAKSLTVAVPAACVALVALGVLYGITCCAVKNRDNVTDFRDAVKWDMLDFGTTAGTIAVSTVFIVYIMNSKKL